MALSLLTLVACSGGSTPATPHPSEPAPVDGLADDQAPSGDHMMRMTMTREALRAALGEAYDQPVSGLDEADVEAGKTLFDAFCVACHGVGGRGDGPAATGLETTPADFTDPVHSRTYSDAGRVQIIRKGSPGTAMAPFEGTLSDRQVLDVYAYVRSLRAATSAAAPTADPPPHAHEESP